VYKQYIDLVETLVATVIERHGNYIATSILHDTDSHNWTENKELYEVSLLRWFYQNVHNSNISFHKQIHTLWRTGGM